MAKPTSKHILYETIAIVCAIAGGAVFLWQGPDAHRNASLMGIAGLVFIVAVAVIVRLLSNPDRVRAEQTASMLTLANELLECMGEEGLTRDSAQKICDTLLPATSGIAVAVTGRENILGYAGIFEESDPHGMHIRTRATRETIKDGKTRVMRSAEEIGFGGEAQYIKAAIVTPLVISGNVEGTLKFYYSSPVFLSETQQSIARGFAGLLSTQMAATQLEQQRKLAKSMELKALQAQINPHFLFNTLNTIAAFTRIDPDRARTLLREFSKFYRATLENSGDLIELSRELEQTKRYFGFELARFGEDAIELDIDIPHEVESIMVPAFIIQPIVENAVRHARPAEGKLTVRVRAEFDERDLQVIVADDGVGMSEGVCANILHPKSDSGLGIAIGNINDRVTNFFGDGSELSFESKLGEGTTVRLYLVGAMDVLPRPQDVQEAHDVAPASAG